MSVCILIPAYRPEQKLLDLVAALGQREIVAIVIVNDGSGASFAEVFAAAAGLPKVVVLHHAVNLGKGAALKTGLNYCLCTFDAGTAIVTADSDGQHAVEDIVRVADESVRNPGALVMGTRQFVGAIPFRSRIGNAITRHILRAVLGYTLRDTQTGLRAVPWSMASQLLKLKSTGYDFELDMLIQCKQLSTPIVETPIQTIYLNGNESSNFNPLLDSMRIYFTMVRYLFASISSAVLDNVLFAILFFAASRMSSLRMAVLISQAGARFFVLFYNYAANKRLVFNCGQAHRRVIPWYLALVAVAGLVSYALMTLLIEHLHFNVIVAKIVAESLIFIPNFAIQRDFIFRNQLTSRGSSEEE